MMWRLGRLALAAVLLAAWQAALQHPIEHVDAAGAFVHVHPGHSNKGSTSGSLCDLLAALTACAAQALAYPGPPRADYEAPFHPCSAPRAAEAPPFLSQGPPASV
jgi:hypothetical protein